MNLHEYQSKELLKKYNVPVQEGMACNTPGEAEEAYRLIKTQYGSNFGVVKAQIHAGGRGKGKIIGKEQRGVAVGKNAEAVKDICRAPAFLPTATPRCSLPIIFPFPRPPAWICALTTPKLLPY